MNVSKITMYVIDFEDLSPEELEYEIKFRIDGIVKIANMETAEIGEFGDNHELNQCDATIEQYEKYFK